MELYDITNVGKVRDNNEDQVLTLLNDSGIALALVCDGLGGHYKGEVASEIAKRHFQDAFSKVKTFSTTKEMKQWLKKVINEAHKDILDYAKKHQDAKGMSTTVVAAIIKDHQMTIANVGDSRAYLYQAGQIEQLTEDQTLVNVLLKSGAINQQEALRHPKRNVLLSAVGGSEELDIDFYQHDIKSDMVLMLCSDGLYNMVSDVQLSKIMSQASILSQCGRRLVDEANRNGGFDNISIALISMGKGERHG